MSPYTIVKLRGKKNVKIHNGVGYGNITQGVKNFNQRIILVVSKVKCLTLNLVPAFKYNLFHSGKSMLLI